MTSPSRRRHAHLSGRSRWPLYLSCILLLMACSAPGFAADEPYWVYTVRPGDTIWDLTRKHCTSVRHWQRIQTLNGVDLDREIPPGTRLKFPLALLKHQPAAATVTRLFGSATLFRAGSQTAEPLRPETRLHSGDRLVTGSDSNLTLRFADDSLLLVQSNSEVVMDALSAWGTTGMVDTRVRLKGGRVDTRVQPGRGPGSRYQIITPAAVAAVRGTDFRISAEPGRAVMRSEVSEGTVTVSNDRSGTDVPAGFGLVAEAGEPPPAPRKLLPGPDLSEIVTVHRQLPLAFDWQPLDGAQGYRFQIATDANFATLLADRTVQDAAAQWPELADGRYALRVRGIDSVGLEGLDSVTSFEVDARPRPPTPSSPADGGTTGEAMPQLVWTASEDAGRYRIQIGRTHDFSNIVTDRIVERNDFRTEQPLSPGAYHWRVAAIEAQGEQGPFSPARTFTYRQPLAAPETGPVIVDNGRLVFGWQAVNGADHYQLQVASDRLFHDIVADHRVAGTEFALPRPPSQVYFFRVRALGTADEAGPFSTTQQFYVPPLYRWWPLVLALPLLLAL